MFYCQKQIKKIQLFFKFLFHLNYNIKIQGLTIYGESFCVSFMEEIKQKETLDKEIRYLINEYDKVLIREKERIEEENKAETKQKRELEKLKA